MSEQPMPPDDSRQTPEPQHSQHSSATEGLLQAVHHATASVKRRSLAWHITRAGAWTLAGALALVILLLAGLTWYTTTADFQRRVSREIVSVLGDATGGRVELRGIHFSLWRLRIVADGLVIHGFNHG